MFMNFPRSPAAHCYVDLVPRLSTIAGFELGTGTFVEIIDPAAAARRLRETE
jgi:galactose-1-phosphate uridylyltransferase